MSNARAKARPDLPAGLQVFGEYVIDQPIDEGPIWTVYRALHVSRQGERFHLWSMKATMSGDRNLVEGFARQARLLEKLSHKGITTVVATGVDQGVIFMVTPESKGQSLRAAMESAGGKLAPTEVARIVREAAEVLDYLHNHRPQIVHRALEPAKIFLADPDKQVKVLEVGYAHALLEAKVEPADALPRAPDGYRAPEDVAGQPVGAPVDQYSLACIAFEALTGKPVTAAGTLPKDVIHPSVEAVLSRARSATVLGRYASVGAFADALARAITVTSKSPATSALPRPGAPAVPKPAATASAPAKPALPTPAAPKPPTPAISPAKPADGPGLQRTGTLGGPGTGGATTATPSATASPAPSIADSATARPPEATTRPVPMAPAGKVGFHQRRGTIVGVGGPAPTASAPQTSGALDGDIEIFGETVAGANTAAPSGASVTPQSGSTARFAALGESGERKEPPPPLPTPAVAPAPLRQPSDVEEVDLSMDDVETRDETTLELEAERNTAPTDHAASDAGGAPPPLPYSVGAPPGVPEPITPAPASLEPPAPPESPAVAPQLPPSSVRTEALPAIQDAPPPPWPPARPRPPLDVDDRAPARKSRSVLLPALGTMLVVGLLGVGGAYYGGLLELPPAVSSLLPARPGRAVINAAPSNATTEHATPGPDSLAVVPHGAGSAIENPAAAPVVTNDASTVAHHAVTDAGAVVATAERDAGAAHARDAGSATTTVAAAPIAEPTTAPPPPTRPAHAGPLPRTPSAHDRSDAIVQIQRRIDACEGHMGRHARMVVRYNSSGNVAGINLAGNVFTGRPIGACIEAAVRAVPYPPFSRPNWDTDYRFYVR